MPNDRDISQPTFLRFILTQNRNRIIMITALAVTILSFCVFKFLYPYPDFFSDSDSYIYAASADLGINIWPIGYSKFLYFFHLLTHSDTSLIAFQYFFLEFSLAIFLFTILYLFRPGKITIYVLYTFFFFNPLFLYVSNYVSSDALFAALSILWFTQLLCIIQRPRWRQIFIQAILLFLCFTVRNYAYYYPIVAIIAFMLSKQSVWVKLTGSILPLALIFAFIIYTRNESYKITGTRQYCLFTGWQLGNNALYMRGHITVDSNELPSAETRQLDQLSRDFYSKVIPDFDDYLSAFVANFFIRHPESPLKVYFTTHYSRASGIKLIADWANASRIYEQYGSWLILHHPFIFTRYFILVNTKNYLTPPLEKLKIYNEGANDISSIAEDWFDYKIPMVTAISNIAQAYILFPLTYLFFFINVFFIGSIFYSLVKFGWNKYNPIFKRITILLISFLILNFLFSVTTSIIVLRYTIVPMLICLSSSLLLTEWIHKLDFKSDKTTIKSEFQKILFKYAKSNTPL